MALQAIFMKPRNPSPPRGHEKTPLISKEETLRMRKRGIPLPGMVRSAIGVIIDIQAKYFKSLK